jgi:uncharacterized protein YcnI
MKRIRLHLRRAALSLALLALTATAAQAHVELTPNNIGGGEYVKLFFRVYHGCEAAPTTGLTVKIPDGVVLARPQLKPGWQISTKTVKYPQPIELGGNTFTEGFSEVTWAGGSIPAAYMDDFAIAALTPQTPGKAYRFVVSQQCAGAAEPLEFTPELKIAGGGGGEFGAYLTLTLAALALVLAIVALLRGRRA